MAVPFGVNRNRRESLCKAVNECAKEDSNGRRDGQDPTQPFYADGYPFCGLRFLNHGADGVYGVNFVLIETDGSEVDAIVLLEKDGDMNGINGLQAATGENG